MTAVPICKNLSQAREKKQAAGKTAQCEWAVQLYVKDASNKTTVLTTVEMTRQGKGSCSLN